MEHIITVRLDSTDYNDLISIKNYLEKEQTKIFNTKIDTTISETIRSCIRRTIYTIKSNK